MDINLFRLLPIIEPEVLARDIKTTKDFIDNSDTIEAPSATASKLTTRVSLYKNHQSINYEWAYSFEILNNLNL
ncbi:unnamed protein product [Adineta steineri]|uniref:Uncharacterized protein n=1 Tax=Adineta steineri TaxID=433720 RepID=A0A815C1J5_9BILA|nr:unnamed protein product [Adineta steineri]CAF3814773.1 unnamed protein product [Adineta steineri]